MGLEAATYIKDLVPANPPGTDPKGEGDNHIRMLKQVLQNNFASYCGPNVPGSTGSANAQAITFSTAPATFVPGMVISFVPGFVNTGPCTISVNSLGPKPLYMDGAPLSGGELQPGQIYEAILDGSLTAFYIISGRPGQAIVNNSGRNRLHNVMLRLQQRGTGPFNTHSVLTADRWRMILTNDTFTVNIGTLTLGAPAAGLTDESARFYLSCNVTGSAVGGSFSAIQQSIEGVHSLSGKTITISFYCGLTAGTANVGVEVSQSFGTGGSPSVTVVQPTVVIPVTSTWARYSTTITLPTIAGKTLGSNGDDGTLVRFWLSNVGNAVGRQTAIFGFWGFQCEEGSVMTKLEKIDLTLDIAQCKRFFHTGAWNIAGYAGAGGGVNSAYPFQVNMRAAPVFTASPTTQTNCSGSSVVTPGNLPNTGYAVTTTVTALGAFLTAGIFTASADL